MTEIMFLVLLLALPVGMLVAEILDRHAEPPERDPDDPFHLGY